MQQCGGNPKRLLGSQIAVFKYLRYFVGYLGKKTSGVVDTA